MRNVFLYCLLFIVLSGSAMAGTGIEIKRSSFDATLWVRQTQSDDYKKWAKEDKLPLSDPSLYNRVRIAQLDNLHYFQVELFDKDGNKLPSLFRAAWDGAVFRQYQEEDEVRMGLIYPIVKTTPIIDLIGPFGIQFQAVMRHIAFEGYEDEEIKIIYDPLTKDMLEIWRLLSEKTPMKAIYSGYKTIGKERLASKLSFQMRTPRYGTVGKTVFTELVEYKAKPEKTIFANIFPEGTTIYNAVIDDPAPVTR